MNPSLGRNMPCLLKFCVAAVSLAMAGGCGSRTPRPMPEGFEHDYASSTPASEGAVRETDKAVILSGVLQLIESSATNPGGDNISLAIESLNDYILDASPEELKLSEPELQFLRANQMVLPEDAAGVIQNARFILPWDGRHLEDALLLQSAAQSVLSRGPSEPTPLQKAEQLFDWTVRQVQLVPPGLLAPPGLRRPDGRPFQAQARPYDVLMRGMATEIEGGWAERSWLFLSLCRQAGLTAGYLAVVRPEPKSELFIPRKQFEAEPIGQLPREVSFACGVAIDGQVYLFDALLGMPIPGPGGVGVATLEQAATDPTILSRLDLPDRSYPVEIDDLRHGKVRVLLEAGECLLAPRMRVLQKQITSERPVVLHADIVAMVDTFRQAVGPRLDDVSLWSLPLNVEYNQFKDPTRVYNSAIAYSIQIFDKRLPLLRARLKHLRGDLAGALEDYVALRSTTSGLMTDGETPIPPDVQEMLDEYSTHFLGLAKADQGEQARSEAEFLFLTNLRKLPEPRPGGLLQHMLRWGSQYNMARLLEADGNTLEAQRYLSLFDPTGQGLGNRLRARTMIFEAPFEPKEGTPVPPSPPTLPPTRRPSPVPSA